MGKVDWELLKFHGDDYSTHKGSTYNSYLIEEEKTVLIDTVWMPFADEFVSNLQKEIDLNKIDYIITTSKKGRKPQRHSVQMRRRAVERSIVTMTALDTANALANSLMSNRTVNDVELVDITKI